MLEFHWECYLVLPHFKGEEQENPQIYSSKYPTMKSISQDN